MTTDDQLDGGIEQCNKNAVNFRTWYAEDMGNPMVFKHPYQRLCTVHGKTIDNLAYESYRECQPSFRPRDSRLLLQNYFFDRLSCQG